LTRTVILIVTQLRDKIEALQVQLVTAEAERNALTVETAELTTQLSQARRVAQEAQELRRAENKPGQGGGVWRDQGRVAGQL
jgi:chorismate mutase